MVIQLTSCKCKMKSRKLTKMFLEQLNIWNLAIFQSVSKEIASLDHKWNTVMKRQQAKADNSFCPICKCRPIIITAGRQWFSPFVLIPAKCLMRTTAWRQKATLSAVWIPGKFLVFAFNNFYRCSNVYKCLKYQCN